MTEAFGIVAGILSICQAVSESITYWAQLAEGE